MLGVGNDLPLVGGGISLVAVVLEVGRPLQLLKLVTIAITINGTIYLIFIILLHQGFSINFCFVTARSV